MTVRRIILKSPLRTAQKSNMQIPPGPKSMQNNSLVQLFLDVLSDHSTYCWGSSSLSDEALALVRSARRLNVKQACGIGIRLLP